MNDLTQKDLFEKYPDIFAQKDNSPRETAMCWGIETGPGWYKIIDALCGTIKGIVESSARKQKRSLRDEDITDDMEIKDYPDLDEYELDEPPSVQAVQVKEKFGKLRFYISARNISESKYKRVEGAISMANAMSAKTCEECGTTDNVEVRTGGWIKTRCDDCYDN